MKETTKRVKFTMDIDYSLPYFQGKRPEDDDVDQDSSSCATNESDCSALVDLKRRVKELDSILDDLETDLANDSENSDDDLLFQDVAENCTTMKTKESRNDTKDVPPLRNELGAVDMVHSLSALFLRDKMIKKQNMFVENHIKTVGSTKEEDDVSTSSSENDSTPKENALTSQFKENEDRYFLWAKMVFFLFLLLSISVLTTYIVLRALPA